MQIIAIKLFNPIYEKWIAPLDARVRGLVVGFVFVLLAVYYPLYHSSVFQMIFYTESQRHCIAAALLMLAAAFSMKGPLEKITWNKWIMVPMCLGGAGLIVTGLLHPIGSGYLVFGLMLLTVYPWFYLVWANRGDYETLFDQIAIANVLAGVCYIAYSVAILPVYSKQPAIVGGRVQGTMMNANLYSMVGMAVFCCALYLVYRKWDMRKLRRLCGAAAVIGLLGVLAGQSRASILICAGCVVIFLIFAAKCGRINRKLVTGVLLACLILMAAGVVFLAAQGGGDEAVGAEQNAIERFLPSGQNLNDYSSNRITLWTNYAQHLNLLGNDFSKTDWTEMTGDLVTHAHNNFLEYGYRCGVIVSGVFMLLELIAGIMTLAFLFSRKATEDYKLFCIFIMLMYAIESLVDIATIPMERYAPFFFYLMLCGTAAARRNTVDGNSENWDGSIAE